LLEKYAFGEIISFYREKFPMNDKRLILAQILDIDGIENSVEPAMLINLSIEQAMEIIRKKVDAYAVEQLNAKDVLEKSRAKKITDLMNKRKE
jgi:hypothetical protein